METIVSNGEGNKKIQLFIFIQILLVIGLGLFFMMTNFYSVPLLPLLVAFFAPSLYFYIHSILLRATKQISKTHFILSIFFFTILPTLVCIGLLSVIASYTSSR